MQKCKVVWTIKIRLDLYSRLGRIIISFWVSLVNLWTLLYCFSSLVDSEIVFYVFGLFGNTVVSLSSVLLIWEHYCIFFYFCWFFGFILVDLGTLLYIGWSLVGFGRLLQLWFSLVDAENIIFSWLCSLRGLLLVICCCTYKSAGNFVSVDWEAWTEVPCEGPEGSS